MIVIIGPTTEITGKSRVFARKLRMVIFCDFAKASCSGEVASTQLRTKNIINANSIIEENFSVRSDTSSALSPWVCRSTYAIIGIAGA
ncbi:hypothetical protein GCM10007094_43330 [Pseudovibrio japonicus]|uniref:Uncharacterized protein n=1 Tax=Pseudovibrio japonicus TaxID=366534 RepID=A0ABQ3ET64_9HYPH|nr:hypothetical protein GCM10007094_43330 [Pseudovibrio japonicus]